jgi:hypothetical protein
MAHLNITATGAGRRFFWRRMIRQWKNSGQTQAEFCRRKRLSLWALRYWRDKLPAKELVQERKSRASFLPVRVIPTSETGLEVQLRSGQVLRVHQDFDPEILKKLISVLEAPTC